MKTHSEVLVAGAAALAFAAAATTVAAANGTSDHHEITLQLPGGGSERIEYTGEALQLVFSPAPLAWPSFAPADIRVPPLFATLERMSAQMDRQMDTFFKGDLAQLSGAPKLDDAALATLPPGTVSTSWFSMSFGNGFCTRVTQITKASAGSNPQIVSRQTGDCGSKSEAPSNSDSRSTAHGSGITQTGLKAYKTDNKPTTL
jgi:hypothetical protein